MSFKSDEAINAKSSKRWLLTINNPQKWDVTKESIMEMLESLQRIYYCMSSEVGESGNFHYHVFVIFSDNVSFKKLKKFMPYAHYDIAKGTNLEVRNYVFKEGTKWQNSEKAGTNIKDSHVESGNFPLDGLSEYLTYIYQLLKDGYNADDIISGKFIHDTYKEPTEEEIAEEIRILTRTVYTTYVQAPQSKDVRAYLKKEHGEENVFFVRPRANGFDGYNGEKVIVFNDLKLPQFRPVWIHKHLESDGKIYTSKGDIIPDYTEVYVISEDSFIKSYISECALVLDIPHMFYKVEAFYNKIHSVMTFENGAYEKLSIGEYFERLIK